MGINKGLHRTYLARASLSVKIAGCRKFNLECPLKKKESNKYLELRLISIKNKTHDVAIRKCFLAFQYIFFSWIRIIKYN